MFGIGIAVTSVLTLITPLAAKVGVGTLITVRLIEGIFEVNIDLFIQLAISVLTHLISLCFSLRNSSGCNIPMHPCGLVTMGATA